MKKGFFDPNSGLFIETKKSPSLFGLYKKNKKEKTEINWLSLIFWLSYFSLVFFILYKINFFSWILKFSKFFYKTFIIP